MLVCEWSYVKLFNPYPWFRNREILDLTNIRAHLFGNNDEADKEIHLGRKYRKGSKLEQLKQSVDSRLQNEHGEKQSEESTIEEKSTDERNIHQREF